MWYTVIRIILFYIFANKISFKKPGMHASLAPDSQICWLMGSAYLMEPVKDVAVIQASTSPLQII